MYHMHGWKWTLLQLTKKKQQNKCRKLLSSYSTISPLSSPRPNGTHTTMSSDHLHILIGLHITFTSSPTRQRTNINLKKTAWTGYKQETERKLSSHYLPTNFQKDEKSFRSTLFKSASHQIPTGRRKLYTQQVPAEILYNAITVRMSHSSLWALFKYINRQNNHGRLLSSIVLHTVSLNCRRSYKEQECARSGHSNICLLFSDETPQSHVVSPS